MSCPDHCVPGAAASPSSRPRGLTPLPGLIHGKAHTAACFSCRNAGRRYPSGTTAGTTGVSESLTDRESWLWSVSKNEAVSFSCATISAFSRPRARPSNRHCRFFCPHPGSGCMTPAAGQTCSCQCVGGEHPSPLPGQDIAVPAEVLNGLKIMVAIRWYHPQHVPVRVQLHHRRRMVGHGKQRSAVRSTSGPERPPCIPGMSFSVASCHCVSGYQVSGKYSGRTGHHQKSASQQCRFLFK